MKHLLLILTLLLTFALMGCGTITTTTEPTTPDAEQRDEQQIQADMLYDLLTVEYAKGTLTDERLQEFSESVEHYENEGDYEYMVAYRELEYLIEYLQDQRESE